VIGLKASELVGTCNQWSAFYPAKRPIMADLIVSGQIDDMLELYGTQEAAALSGDRRCLRGRRLLPQHGQKGRWLYFTAAPLRNALGEVIGAIETLQDITERKSAEMELLRMHADLEAKVARRTEQLQRAKASLEQDIARRERPRRNCSSATLNSPNSTAACRTPVSNLSSPRRWPPSASSRPAWPMRSTIPSAM
jgi:two-component system NtrC family sensor kinase